MAHRMHVDGYVEGTVDHLQDVFGYAGGARGGEDVIDRAIGYLEDIVRATGKRVTLIVDVTEDALPPLGALDSSE